MANAECVVKRSVQGIKPCHRQKVHRAIWVPWTFLFSNATGEKQRGYSMPKRARIAAAALYISSLSASRWVSRYRIARLQYESAKTGSYACGLASANRLRISNAALYICSLSAKRWVSLYKTAKLL